MKADFQPLSYGMPNCPACEKHGLVLTDKNHVACILCDYKRDLSKDINKPKKNDSDGSWFIFLLIVGFVLFVMISS
ncbi:hypothetical protein Lepto7375DRAFT_6339 [Leptolyngbya sp. PCC 7375]|nr:hypothetical protein Lepto7375DRAFT_6339 [Leptolyngbya sp. PCC 7375]